MQVFIANVLVHLPVSVFLPATLNYYYMMLPWEKAISSPNVRKIHVELHGVTMNIMHKFEWMRREP